MKTKENIEVIKRFLDEVWHKGNEAIIDELYAYDGRARGFGGDFEAGPTRFKAFYRLVTSTCTGIRVDIKSIMAEGDEVLFFGAYKLTHKATGKKILIDAAGLAKMANGKIIEACNIAAFMDLLIQLNVLPADALPKALLETK